MGKKTKEKAATAAAPATPAPAPTEIGRSMTVADLQKAEELVKRLEFLGATVGQQIEEQALRLGNLLGELAKAEAGAAKPADVPTAAARSEKPAAGVGGIVNGYPVFDKLIRDHFERASLHEILAALIFYEVWRIDWETPLADDLLKICIDSLENASASEIEDVDFPFGILVGMRACRT